MENPEVQLTLFDMVMILLFGGGAIFVVTFVLLSLGTIVSQVVKNYWRKGTIPPEEAHQYHWIWGYAGPDRRTDVPWYRKPGNRLERE